MVPIRCGAASKEPQECQKVSFDFGGHHHFLEGPFPNGVMATPRAVEKSPEKRRRNTELDAGDESESSLAPRNLLAAFEEVALEDGIAEIVPQTECVRCGVVGHRKSDCPLHSTVFRSKYHGVCRACHKHIHPGDKIVRSIVSDGYMHPGCALEQQKKDIAEEDIAEAREAAARKREAIRLAKAGAQAEAPISDYWLQCIITGRLNAAPAPEPTRTLVPEPTRTLVPRRAHHTKTNGRHPSLHARPRHRAVPQP